MSAGDPDRVTRVTRVTPVTPRAQPSAHRHPGLLALIFVGGTLGTAARAAIESALPAASGRMPWATLCINVAGSLLLGLLLETLTRTGSDSGWRRAARLTLGTGVLGGFTTYSTLAVETVQRLTPDALVTGLAYALVSVVLGVAAAAAGYGIARRLFRHPRRERRR